MITDGQIRLLQRWLNEGKTLRESATRCGMDEKTARRYQRLGSAARVRPPRTWRTRTDPFSDVWAGVEARLVADPRLKAVTLFAQLQREHLGRFTDAQRRTFERRVQRWRAMSGRPKAAIFEQVHPPGRLCSFDFTDVSSLKVTIAGRAFPHMLFHAVLTHSNAESVRICFSESFESLSAGLQAALHEFGGVPERVRSDSLSAAVNNLSSVREFRERYRALLNHYRLEGEKTNPRQAHDPFIGRRNSMSLRSAACVSRSLRRRRLRRSPRRNLAFLVASSITPRGRDHLQDSLLARLEQGPQPFQRPAVNPRYGQALHDRQQKTDRRRSGPVPPRQEGLHAKRQHQRKLQHRKENEDHRQLNKNDAQFGIRRLQRTCRNRHRRVN